MKTNLLCQPISLYQFRSASLKDNGTMAGNIICLYEIVQFILQYCFTNFTALSISDTYSLEFLDKKVTVIFVVGRSLPEGDLVEKFFGFKYIFFKFFISMYIVFHHTVCTYLPLFQVLPESGHQTIVEICCNTTQAFLKT